MTVYFAVLFILTQINFGPATTLGHIGLRAWTYLNLILNLRATYQATKSELAVTYNVMSVLENYHAAQLFRILNDKESGMLDTLNPEEYTAYRDVKRKEADHKKKQK